MLIVGFPAAAFGTNCYVLAPAEGEQCLVIDPGVEVVAQLEEVLREHRLRPAAVLLTHGHLDHTFSVTPVCGARDVPAYIHAADAYRLADPLSSLSPALLGLFGAAGPGSTLDWTEPEDVRPLPDGGVLELAGLSLAVAHAPGHTEGSVLFELPSSADAGPVCLSGDVLFAGSVGRTDLPGGDPAAMLTSLRTKILPLHDETIVLPGHGPQTTIARERATNPYLRELITTR